MKLGKIKPVIFFFLFFSNLYSENTIFSTPIINLENLEPSYENADEENASIDQLEESHAENESIEELEDIKESITETNDNEASDTISDTENDQSS